MIAWLKGWNQHATPVAAATFLVVGITGVMMFFHLAQHEVEDLHGWFGLGLVAAVLLHLWRNWAAMVGYTRRGPALWVALGLAAAGTAGFLGASLLGGEEGGGGGMRAVFSSIEQSPLRELAPVFDTTPEALAAKLTAAGLQGASPDATPKAIAEASGTDPRAVMEKLGG